MSLPVWCQKLALLGSFLALAPARADGSAVRVCFYEASRRYALTVLQDERLQTRRTGVSNYTVLYEAQSQAATAEVRLAEERAAAKRAGIRLTSCSDPKMKWLSEECFPEGGPPTCYVGQGGEEVDGVVRTSSPLVIPNDPSLRRSHLSARICFLDASQKNALRALERERRGARLGGVVNNSLLWEILTQLRLDSRRIERARMAARKEQVSLISCSDPAMVDAVMCTMLLGSQAADGHGCERDEIASLAHIAREPVERAKPEEPIGEAEADK